MRRSVYRLCFSAEIAITHSIALIFSHQMLFQIMNSIDIRKIRDIHDTNIQATYRGTL